MDITLNAVAYRNGVPVQTELNLTRRSDGTWHATNFDDILRDTSNASKSGASQRDTCEADTAARTKLSGQEIAELAGKYNPHNMTQGQYDEFLDDLIEKGALFASTQCGWDITGGGFWMSAWRHLHTGTAGVVRPMLPVRKPTETSRYSRWRTWTAT